jgi:hypothetical protein
MTDKPRRVQLSRKKGWRMPENTVSVARGPGRKWGNPFRVGDFGIPDAAEAVRVFRQWLVDGVVSGPPRPDATELRGKNLACWCKIGDPCHADALLRRAAEYEDENDQ